MCVYIKKKEKLIKPLPCLKKFQWLRLDVKIKSRFVSMDYKALFSSVPSPAILLECPTPATLSFHMADHLRLCVFVRAISYACDCPSSTLLPLLISCISIRYRLKCHFLQEALPEPPVLWLSESCCCALTTLAEYSSLSSLIADPPFQ